MGGCTAVEDLSMYLFEAKSRTCADIALSHIEADLPRYTAEWDQAPASTQASGDDAPADAPKAVLQDSEL